MTKGRKDKKALSALPREIPARAEVMASEDSWHQVRVKAESAFSAGWQEASAKREAEETAAAIKQKKIAAAAEAEVSEAKKAKLLSVGDTIKLLQHELGVDQFDAREALIRACASGEVWYSIVLPNRSELNGHFIDPRWWEPNLGGILFYRDSAKHREIDLTESPVFIDVESILSWVAKKGWLAKRGQIEWYPGIGDFGSKRDGGNDGNRDKLFNLPESNTEERPPRVASKSTIDKAIGQAYAEAGLMGEKPPNIKEIVPLVQRKLSAKGYQASGRQIQMLAEAGKYKHQRRKPGRTAAREKRCQSR
jgi:hypothetical protein